MSWYVLCRRNSISKLSRTPCAPRGWDIELGPPAGTSCPSEPICTGAILPDQLNERSIYTISATKWCRISEKLAGCANRFSWEPAHFTLRPASLRLMRAFSPHRKAGRHSTNSFTYGKNRQDYASAIIETLPEVIRHVTLRRTRMLDRRAVTVILLLTPLFHASPNFLASEENYFILFTLFFFTHNANILKYFTFLVKWIRIINTVTTLQVRLNGKMPVQFDFHIILCKC